MALEVAASHPQAKARARAGFFFGLLAAAILPLAGCISLPQSAALREAPPEGLAPRVELVGVPFHRQDDFLCGPAALAMAHESAGIAASVESLTPLVYLPGRQGSLQAEMLGATRRQGLVAYTTQPQLVAVLREAAAGNPSVVLLNLGLRVFPLWHYAVVIGYDLEADKVVLRSGDNPRRELSTSFFEYLWKDSGYWAMLALPPGKVPATAGESDFAAAVAALEGAGRGREARGSYRALLSRWPLSYIGLMGLGNVEYALGDRAAAEYAFRRAAEAHPEAGAAFNNWAHVLSELGRMQEAETAARRAVALGGPSAAQAQKTLEEILARRASRP